MDDILFPSAPRGNIRVTSQATEEYNCVAWAAHNDARVIWPDELEQWGWPPEVPRAESIEALIGFFELTGFSNYSTADFEAGFEKIVTAQVLA
jgi:hypothetical protein